MRIAVLVRVLWNGGVQRAAIEGVRGLKKLGKDCDLIFVRRAFSSYELAAGTRILFDEDSEGRRRWSSLLWLVTSIFAKHRGRDATVDLDLMARACRVAREYDSVIYVDQWAALIGLWNKILFGRPFALFLHEFFRRPPSGRLYPVLMISATVYDHLVIALADAVITSSNYNYQIVSSKRQRVLLARLGCAEATSSQTERKRQVLSLTLWDRGRKPSIYLEIAKNVPNAEFIMAGGWTEQDYEEEIKTLARQLPNVRITGEISEEERERLLEESLVYLRFGWSERGPGMGGLEALGHGCIVVANSELGISEIVTNGIDGFIVNKVDPTEVSALLRDILSSSPSRLEAIGSAARALCRRMSWEEHARVLLQAISELQSGTTGGEKHVEPTVL